MLYIYIHVNEDTEDGLKEHMLHTQRWMGAGSSLWMKGSVTLDEDSEVPRI